MAIILDNVKNFAKGAIVSPAGLAIGATTMSLNPGDAARFPDPAVKQFNVVIFNSSDFDDPSDDPNVEIVRCTAVLGDDFTIVRGQEGTTDVAHDNPAKVYTVFNGITKKMIDDIQASSLPAVQTINQVAHGLSVDNVIRSSGTDGEFTKSKADTALNADVEGIVTQVIDADNFVISMYGFATLSALPGGSVAGDDLFLSDSVAGGLTLTEPTTPPTVSKPVCTVINAATKLVRIHDFRGQTNQLTPVNLAFNHGTDNSRSGTDASGSIVIPHGLGVVPAIVEIVARAGDDNTNLIGQWSDGSYVTSFNTNKCVYTTMKDTSGDFHSGEQSNLAVFIANADNLANNQSAVITVDATNITITFTKNGAGAATGAINIKWKAVA